MPISFTISDVDDGSMEFGDFESPDARGHSTPLTASALDRLLANAPRPEPDPSGPITPQSFVQALMNLEIPALSDEKEYLIKFLEDLISAGIRLKQNRDMGNIAHILWDFTRARTGKSTYTTVKELEIKRLFNSMTSTWRVQSKGDEAVAMMRGLLTKIDILETSDIARKFQEFVCYLLAIDIFGIAGKVMSVTEFAYIFADYKERKYKSKIGFVRGVIDFLITLYERIKVWKTTGDITTVLINNDAASVFLRDAAEVIRLSASYGNLSAVGSTEADFTRLLLHCIDYGDSIATYVGTSMSAEKRYILKKLNELKLIRDSHLTADAAAQFRREPYSAMIYGHSGVGKTQFMAMIMSQVNRVLGFKDTEDNVYVFSPSLKHHDGYRSGKVHCVYDDGASENVNKVQFGSGSTLETPIQAVNTAPWILPMAALEKKGKVRFDPEFVWMTSNVIDMNARHMFSSELALRRRFPVIIEARVKPEYSTNGMLDPAKVPALEPGCRQNTWNITIYRVAAKPANRLAVQEALLIHDTDFTDIEDFMSWLTKDIFSFRARTLKAESMRHEMREIALCYKLVNGVPQGCYKAMSACTCGGTLQMDEHVEFGFDFRPPPIDVQPPDRRPIRDRRTPNMRPNELLHIGADPAVVQQAMEAEQEFDRDRTPELAAQGLRDTNVLPSELVGHVAGFISRQRSRIRQWWREPLYAHWPSQSHPLNIAHIPTLIGAAIYYTCFGFWMFLYYAGIMCVSAWWSSGRPWNAQDQPYFPGEAGIRLILATIVLAPFYVTLAGVMYFVYLYYSDLIFRTAIQNFVFFCKLWYKRGYGAAFAHVVGLCSRDIGRRIEEKMSRIMPNDVIVMLSYLSAAVAFSYIVGTIAAYPLTRGKQPKLGAKPPVSKEKPKLVKRKGHVKVVPRVHTKTTEYDSDSDQSIASFEPRREILGVDNLLGDEAVMQADEVEDVVKQNPWYKGNFELTPLHLTRTSRSWKSFTKSELLKRLSSNIYDIHVRKEETWANGTMFGIHENYFIICKHFITILPTQLRYSQTREEEGIRAWREVQIDATQVHFLDGEVVVLFLPDLPMVKSCLELLPRETFGGSQNGHIITRRRGEFTSIYSEYISFVTTAPNVPGLDGTMQHYARCEVTEPTRNGDCGSPVILHTNFGPVIYGIHVIGMEREPRSISFCQYLDFKSIKGVTESRYGALTLQDNVIELDSETADRQLVELHYKSPVRFIEQGCGYVFGSITGHRGKPKSRVTKTLFYEEMIKDGYEDKYDAPVLGGWEPKHHILRAATDKQKSNWLQMDLDKVFAAYCKHIKANFVEKPILHPLTLDEAINGIDGVAFIDKLPMHTSSGYPWNRCKKEFLVRQENGRYTLNDEAMRCFERIWDALSKGIVWEPVMTSALKDELRKYSKIESKSTRVFQGSHFVWAIVGRMLILPLIALIQEHTQIFCMYPGTNVNSKQWHRFAEYLCRFAAPNIKDMETFKNLLALLNDGDFGKFDVTMDPKAISVACDFLLWLARWVGYGDLDSLRLRAVLKPLINPYVNFFGDLVRLVGINPSGHIATVIINCLISIFSLMVCYLLLNPEGECDSFFENVSLGTYGDDNIQGLSPNIPWFNHLTIAKKMKELGLEYTMADKDSTPTPYQTITQTSFLKRYFRFDEDVGAILAPLHEESITKSLLKCVRSKSVTLEEQNMDALESALCEYFNYGRPTFEEKRRYFKDLVRRVGLTHRIRPSTFPTWETLLERYRAA